MEAQLVSFLRPYADPNQNPKDISSFKPQSSQRNDSNKDFKETTAEVGPRRRRVALSLLFPLKTAVTVRGDLLEQRAAGGRQPSKKKGVGTTWGRCDGRPVPRSIYILASLPAAELLGLPVASLIDMNLLTCELVLAELEPPCFVVVVRRT